MGHDFADPNRGVVLDAAGEVALSDLWVARHVREAADRRSAVGGAAARLDFLAAAVALVVVRRTQVRVGRPGASRRCRQRDLS